MAGHLAEAHVRFALKRSSGGLAARGVGCGRARWRIGYIAVHVCNQGQRVLEQLSP
jgi:hypothetical protein